MKSISNKLILSARTQCLNRNTVVFGSAGTGKTRFFIKPNILQADGSIVCTDAYGEIMRDTGYYLQEIEKYDVRCLNLDDMSKSCHFNPFAYIYDEVDIAVLVDAFYQNRNIEEYESESHSDFWSLTEKLLLCACFGYVHEVYPAHKQCLKSVLELIHMAVQQEADSQETVLDSMFHDLGNRNPDSYAYQQYCRFQNTDCLMQKNIFIIAAAHLAQLDIPEVQNLTSEDNLCLNELGTRKMAIFLIPSVMNNSFRWLTAIFYELILRRLYLMGRQNRIPVKIFMDECVHIGKLPTLPHYLLVCRQSNVSIMSIFQSYSHVMALYGKEVAEAIVLNHEACVFAGGRDNNTLFLLQNLSNDSVFSDELATMRATDCFVITDGGVARREPKYNIDRHPKRKFLSDGRKGRPYMCE